MTYRDEDDAALLRRNQLALSLMDPMPDDDAREAVAREIAAIDRQRLAAARVRLPVVARAQIASPCPERWEAMTGDGAVRACARCEKEVFDLSLMTLGQAEALIAARGGKETCARIFRRRDGTMMFADCEVGARGVVMRQVGAAGTALMIGGAALAWANQPPAVAASSPLPSPAPSAEAVADAFLHAPAPPFTGYGPSGYTPYVPHDTPDVDPGVFGGMGLVVFHARPADAPEPHGVVTIGRPVPVPTGGVFPAAQITRALRAAEPRILECYETELRRYPDFAGEATVQVTIHADGRAHTGRVIDNTMAPHFVAHCAAHILGSLQFAHAPRAGSASFQVHLAFAPSGDAALERLLADASPGGRDGR